ncbi:hypothetical protein AZE42_12031 [Rhizopogon vesiculosus]|uniref:Uncharacterized protein n=1 Tax=Rhizopogon vesiculosus TaxID=180088 RepID=A0A1J8QJJ4_9AGAM|nr:hypothetical protein AZE42_12031 [Rhizopogon vesiculosus]
MHSTESTSTMALLPSVEEQITPPSFTPPGMPPSISPTLQGVF